jgi:hypothetical protein
MSPHYALQISSRTGRTDRESSEDSGESSGCKFIIIMKYCISYFTIMLGTVLFGILSATMHAAEPTTRESKIENWSPIELAALKGKIVVFEGLYWGLGWPALGSRVVLPSGQRVYLHNAGRGDNVPNGQLVRVRGKLALRHMHARKTDHSPGYKKGFDYWTIEDPLLEKIDRVESEEIKEFATEQPQERPPKVGSKTNCPQPSSGKGSSSVKGDFSNTCDTAPRQPPTNPAPAEPGSAK